MGRSGPPRVCFVHRLLAVLGVSLKATVSKLRITRLQPPARSVQEAPHAAHDRCTHREEERSRNRTCPRKMRTPKLGDKWALGGRRATNTKQTDVDPTKGSLCGVRTQIMYAGLLGRRKSFAQVFLLMVVGDERLAAVALSCRKLCAR